MKTPRVRTILQVVTVGGMPALKKYFEQKDLVIDPDSWTGHIKKLIEEKKEASAMMEIELILLKFKLLKNGQEKDSSSGK